MAPRTDGFEVVWAITAASRGRLEWREVGDDHPPRRSACDPYGFVPQGTETLRIRLDGLAPGTEVEFRTVTEAVQDGRCHTSDWKRIRTLDPSATSSTFVVWNDTHQHDDTLAALDDRSPRGDFWVWNGDVCNNWTDRSEIIPTILAPAGRDVTDGRPMVFNWGNHDVRGPWAHRVPEIIASPEGRPYQAFRSGPVAAIVLSTGEDKPDDHPSFAGRVAFAELHRRQAEWLADQVQRPGFVDAPYRVVFCHVPLRWHDEALLTATDYATGRWDLWSRTGRELWHQTLAGWGAQVVISGHNHEAARLDPTDDFPYTQLLGGGPRPEEATWLEGDADDRRLMVTIRRLDGEVVEQVGFEPIT